MKRHIDHTDSSRRSSFPGLSLATTLATYALIAVGVLVRAAGAGLGCPDWPRCFGRWVPPTSVADLPPGFDPALFNPVNTWLEYVNRLLGVVIGLLIFATLISAWRNHRRVPQIIWPSTAAFVLVGVQGWLGGQVVARGLHADVLTAHMVLALIIVGLLLYAHLEARYRRQPGPPHPGHDHRPHAGDGPDSRQTLLGRLGLGLGLLTLFQVALGTQVRGILQELEKTGVPRAEWLPLGWWPDLAHRQLALAAVAAAALLVWATRRQAPAHAGLRLWSRAILGLSAAQIAIGLGLAYLAVPPPLQVLHLALASLLIGAISVYVFQAFRVPAAKRENG